METKTNSVSNVKFFTDDLTIGIDLVAVDLAYIVKHVSDYSKKQPDCDEKDIDEIMEHVLEYLTSSVRRQLLNKDKMGVLSVSSRLNVGYCKKTQQ